MDRQTRAHFLLAILQDQERFLAACASVQEVYEFMGYLAEQVHAVYPIGCFAGCSACCVASNTPTLTLEEWRLLFGHLQTFALPQQQVLVRRAAAFCGPRLELLWQLQQALDAPVSMESWQRFRDLMPQLGTDDCVFLANGLCGVYPARPAKCRAHGNFILRYQDLVQVHSCEPEHAKFEKYVSRQDNRRLLMPLWNVFEKRLRELNATGSTVTALPIWMLYHLDAEHGRLVPEVIDRPDWTRLSDPSKRETWRRALDALAPPAWSGRV